MLGQHTVHWHFVGQVKQDVEDELKKMLNATELDNSKQEVFKMCTTACKQIFEWYDEQQKEEILKLVSRQKFMGNDKRT